MKNKRRRIGLVNVLCLVFSILLAGCSANKTGARISIHWEKEKPAGIVVPFSLLEEAAKDSIGQLLHIRLAGMEQAPAILGKYMIRDDGILFRPLLPFTRGLNYTVAFRGRQLDVVKIPAPGPAAPTVVSFIYPHHDTLPENLLKIYLFFSGPMQEGQALEHVALVRGERDTLSGVFLDLQPELWNSDRTVLTLWLDPGRIKRDLQPNRQRGVPLQEGSRYQLLVSPGWRNASGGLLEAPYRQVFVAGKRDDLSPDPGKWTIQPPAAGSFQPLHIAFREPLDYRLAANTIRLASNKGRVVAGHPVVHADGTGVSIYPSVEWVAGEYALEIESRLEDLAGNNLDRLFDNDLRKGKPQDGKEIYKRYFRIVPE